MEKQRILEKTSFIFCLSKNWSLEKKPYALFWIKGYASHLQDLQTIGTDIRLNFDNLSDSLETYAAIESKNREIDQMNLSLQTAEKRTGSRRTFAPVTLFRENSR